MLRRFVNMAILTLSVALGIGAVSSAPAIAQFGMAGADMLPQQVITKRGVEAYVKILGLDKDQREVAMTLLEGNQNEYQAARKKMEEGMRALGEKARETEDFSIFRTEGPKLGSEFREKAKSLEKAFFDDLKASLNNAQLANWAKVERLHRREKGLRFAFVSGGNVDLNQVIERSRAKPASGAEFETVLDQYDLELDKEVISAEQIQKDLEDNAGKDGMNFDPARVEASLKPAFENAKSIRETNREYARKLSQLMDDSSKARFNLEFNRRNFPRIYNESYVQKMLNAATSLTDLNTSQKESVGTLKSSYEQDAGPINDRWAKATQEREDKAGGSIMVLFKNGMGMATADLNKDVNDARTARKELDEKTKNRLTGILSEEQMKKMPEQAADRNPNPLADFMTPEEE
jgi:hypothetical protein